MRKRKDFSSKEDVSEESKIKASKDLKREVVFYCEDKMLNPHCRRFPVRLVSRAIPG